MQSKNVNHKILNCIERMVCDFHLNYQFYGEFCSYINFHRTDKVPTMGVNVSKSGMNFYFNEDFANSLSQEEINFVVIHEVLHLLYDHPARSANYDHKMANVAQDMIINYVIAKDFNQKFVNQPKDTLELPKEYEQLVKNDERKLYFPDVYQWLLDKKEEYEQEKKENGKGSGDQKSDSGSEVSGSGSDSEGNGSDSDGNGKSGGNSKPQTPNSNGAPDAEGNYPNGKKSKIDKQLRDIFDTADTTDDQLTIDEHMQNEVDSDYAKEVVNQVKEGLKARGLGKGNVETVLDRIQRKRKDYLKEIKRSISSLKGTSAWKTINRPNIFSMKGIKGKKRTGKGLNVILDTSGSMYGTFEKILSYIFQRNILINLIQVDTDIQSFQTLSDMKDFRNLKIKGLGGTVLQPGIEYIKTEKALRGFNLLVLTDGYTDTLNFNDLPGCKKVLIISNGTKVPIDSSNGTTVKQIVVPS